MALEGMQSFLDQQLLDETNAITLADEYKLKPYSLGIFPEELRDSENIEIYSMSSKRRDVVVDNALGNPPIEVKPHSLDISTIKMAHYRVNSTKNEFDYRMLLRQLQAYQNGIFPTITGTEMLELVNAFYAKMFADNLKHLVDNKTYMFDQLLTNPNGCVVTNDVHNSDFTYTLNNVTTTNAFLADLTINPISQLQNDIFLPALQSGKRITDVWIGIGLMQAVMKSEIWSRMNLPLQPHNFTYNPAMAPNVELNATNAQRLFNVNGIDVTVINDVVNIDGASMYPFGINTAIGFDRNNFMIDLHAPTYRFKEMHSEKMSFFEMPAIDEKVDQMRSEAFYLTAVINSQNLFRAIYS